MCWGTFVRLPPTCLDLLQLTGHPAECRSDRVSGLCTPGGAWEAAVPQSLPGLRGRSVGAPTATAIGLDPANPALLLLPVWLPQV